MQLQSHIYIEKISSHLPYFYDKLYNTQFRVQDPGCHVVSSGPGSYLMNNYKSLIQRNHWRYLLMYVSWDGLFMNEVKTWNIISVCVCVCVCVCMCVCVWEEGCVYYHATNYEYKKVLCKNGEIKQCILHPVLLQTNFSEVSLLKHVSYVCRYSQFCIKNHFVSRYEPKTIYISIQNHLT